MRIAIDYTPALRQQAGIGRIVRGQLSALLERPHTHDIRLLVVGRVSADDVTHAPLPLHATPLSERNMVRLWHRLDSPIPPVEWFTGGPLDLFHATDFVLPPSRARHKVLTIHDLAFRFFPDAAMPSLHHYLNVVVPRSVRRADHIIADSHHTAHDLHAEWHVTPDRISVVQGGVDHSRFRPVRDEKRTVAARRRYSIGDGPFILAVSRLEPRKNYVRLIRAFHAARAVANLPHNLVIGGSKGWLYDDIFGEVQKLGLSECVHFTGFVADDDLPALYSAADCCAYPSLYEGFGLPIIEALACGTPVLTGDNSCLPEAGGPGALYVNVMDVDAIAEGLLRIITDDALRSSLAEAGLAHAAQFTWQRSAEQLTEAYRRAVSH